MSLASHAERLQARLDRLKEDEKTATQRVANVASFVGGCAATAAYRAYLTKENKAMPKLGPVDADTALGAAMIVAGFFEVIPAEYAEYALNFGTGMVSAGVASKVAGWVNPAMATKGDEPYQLGASPNVSAFHGDNVLDMIRRRQNA